MTPIIVKSQTVSVGNEQIEVKGEVFTEPVRQTENVTCYTRVTFKNENGLEVYSTRYFEPQVDEVTLDSLVENLKNKMLTDFEKAHK